MVPDLSFKCPVCGNGILMVVRREGTEVVNEDVRILRCSHCHWISQMFDPKLDDDTLQIVVDAEVQNLRQVYATLQATLVCLKEARRHRGCAE